MCPHPPSLRSAGVSGLILADDCTHRQFCEAALEVQTTAQLYSMRGQLQISWLSGLVVTELQGQWFDSWFLLANKCPWTRP